MDWMRVLGVALVVIMWAYIVLVVLGLRRKPVHNHGLEIKFRSPRYVVCTCGMVRRIGTDDWHWPLGDGPNDRRQG